LTKAGFRQRLWCASDSRKVRSPFSSSWNQHIVCDKFLQFVMARCWSTRMKPSAFPSSESELLVLLRALQNQRRESHLIHRSSGRKRVLPNAELRSAIFKKTGGRCHICGGALEEKRWKADHVESHSRGGLHSEDNFLPAHGLCNGYRWDYSPEEFQWILKIGVWARNRMRKAENSLDRELLQAFFNHETHRLKRRKRTKK
jgi:hypothetical protein